MIPNFNDIFKKDPSIKQKVPAAVLEYLNTTIPKGTKYTADDKGNITMEADGKPLEIGGFTIVSPKGVKEKLTPQQKLQYAYNAQTGLKIEPKEAGYFIVNGEKVSVDKLYNNVYEDVKYKNGEFFVYPEPFPAPRDISVGNGKYLRILKLSRVPYPSLEEIHFETEEKKSLELKISVNEKNGKSDFFIAYNPEYASSVKEIVESISIFNSFVEGQGYIMNKKIKINNKQEKREKIDKNSQEFWEKVLKLEEILKVKFKPEIENVNGATVRNVEQLYQNLVLKNPVRENRMFTSITTEDGMNNVEKLRKSIGAELYFQYNGSLKMVIFDQTIDCPSLFGMFNCKLVDIKQEGKQTKLEFANVSDEKKGYTSVLSFVTEDELQKYGVEVDNNHALSLRDAKSVDEYLREDE